MKVFVVRIERDGRTVKAPGVSETEIKREDHLFVADSLLAVWDAIEAIRSDPEAHVIGLWEQHPSVQVLAPSSTKARGR